MDPRKITAIALPLVALAALLTFSSFANFKTDRNTGHPDQTVSSVISADKDSDNDGVTDSDDKCPNTPAGVQVGPDGCPVPQDPSADDTDGDGVPNAYDLCPNTPWGTPVDSHGCPR
ncbi:thrombospondin type 3 repeat-containing protein [Chitinophaga eiseniae]|uniref:Thrombospondin type 3 repeat-containing protein n=1 Tax=Chitinophaga eiseniae TaxID=634771 RepID=A0A847SCS4_9BACT|nr:hypothetical protein [Chitinophaga eiseniae]